MKYTLASIAILILSSLLPYQEASALTVNGSTYWEVCLAESGTCAVGKLNTVNGEYTAYSLSALTPDEPLNFEVMDDAQYTYLKAHGMEKVTLTIAEATEVKDINNEVEENFAKCILSSVACILSSAEAFTTGGFAAPLAYISCVQAGYQCKEMYVSNQKLALRREKIQKKVGAIGATHSGGGGGTSFPNISGPVIGSGGSGHIKDKEPRVDVGPDIDP